MPDMGIHHIDPAFHALSLDPPETVEATANRATLTWHVTRPDHSAVVDLESELFDGPRVLRWLDDASLSYMYDQEPGMAAAVGESSDG